MNTAQTGRVLVVDDEVDLALLIEGYLRKAGLDVAVRHDGTDAVDAVRDFDPDVVVLDLGLPGIDGIEVCRQVRTLSDCHVLMLTARDDEIDKIIGLSVGQGPGWTSGMSRDRPASSSRRVRWDWCRSRSGNRRCPSGLPGWCVPDRSRRLPARCSPTRSAWRLRR